MHKSFDGLCGIITKEMKGNPLDGSVYIFVNRRRNKMKLLLWQQGGFVLYYKRLERGTFEFPKSNTEGSYKMDWQTLLLMIRGLSLVPKQVKKRYKRA